MNKIFLAVVGIVFLTSFTNKAELSEECDVAEFYKAVEPDSDVKVLTTSGKPPVIIKYL